MTGLFINPEKCTGCGLCVKSCAAGALVLTNKKAAAGDSCTLCGICADACPFKAISIQKNSLEEKGAAEHDGIWVFAEQQNGQLLNVGLELLGIGRELADIKGCTLTAVMWGDNIAKAGQTLIAYGADRVFACEAGILASNSDEHCSAVIHRLIESEKPEVFLFGATGFGRSLAPRLAARSRTGLTADCTGLGINPETGLLEQTRPAFGGNLMATIVCPNHRPQMATVRPGVMTSLVPSDKRKGQIVRVPCPEIGKPLVEQLADICSNTAGSIADAKIIVSAGKGIGSRKNMALVYELASLLGGEVGVSRPLVDAGWCEYKHQIGQTGCSVAPDLLIACGISGAIQHLAGMSGAKRIIAINNDPQAPIFKAAQYAAIGDCVEILQELVAAFRTSGCGDPKRPKC